MKMLRKLGKIFLNQNNTKQAYCAEYECPECRKPTIHRTSDVDAGRIKRCKVCTITYRRTKNLSPASFNMKMIGNITYRLPNENSTSGNQPYVHLECPTCNTIKEYQAVSAAIYKHHECLRCRKSVKIIDNKKQCSSCKEVKDVSEFFKSKKALSGLSPLCKTCASISTKNYELKVGKDFIRNKAMAKQYNITQEEVALLKKTETCGICNYVFVSNRDKHIDHCHATGKVRGILCSKCNHGLGHFRDNIQNLEGAIKWLQNNGLE